MTDRRVGALAQIAALVLALARAIPALERILGIIEERRREARAAELHHAIDDAIARARSSTPVCPRPDCPLFRRGLLHAPAEGAKPDGTVPPSS